MSMNDYRDALKRNQPGEEQILEVLFECYNAMNGFDNDQIRRDFEALYEAMHDKPLREQDEVVYATCALCRDHEKVGFIEGVKVGLRLAREVGLLDE